jgi:hypothetical protein
VDGDGGEPGWTGGRLVTARYFCNACLKEISPPEHWQRLERTLAFDTGTTVKVTALVTVDGVTNAGHVCHACIVRTINEGAPVP